MGRPKNPTRKVKLGYFVLPGTHARIKHQLLVEGKIGFDEWIRALMARERLYRVQTRELHAELTKLRAWHLPFDQCDTQGVQQAPALRPSEDDQYDYLLRRTQP